MAAWLFKGLKLFPHSIWLILPFPLIFPPPSFSALGCSYYEVNIGASSSFPSIKFLWSQTRGMGWGIKLVNDTHSALILCRTLLGPSCAVPGWPLWASQRKIWFRAWDPFLWYASPCTFGTTGWGNRGSVYHIKFLETWGGLFWTLHHWWIFPSAALSTWQENLNYCHF